MSLSDYNVPLLVHYGPESHAAAGALVALGTDAVLSGYTSKGRRLLIAVGSALALGAAKEYLLDRHPHAREIAPWGVGAAAALSFRYTF